jgi:hypothetical protein
VLFKLLAFADDEKDQYLAKTGSTGECVSSVRTWADKREEISEILNEFYTRPELLVCALCLMISCRYLPKFRNF